MSAARDFTGGYVRRVVDTELDELFPQLPAILLDGPKGVGKTATARQRARTVRRLDVPAEAAVVVADPNVIADDVGPVLLDEWHRIPATWDAVRRFVDDDQSPGRFLLTGSPPGPGTHSGAGRIDVVRVRPLAFCERFDTSPEVSLASLLSGDRPKITGRSPFTLTDYVEEIVVGGFPGMRHLSGRALTQRIDSYVDRIVDHDLPEAGFVARRPEALRAWLRAYAAATATTASWETIRDAATGDLSDKPARKTATAYADLLKALRVLDPIEAWRSTHNHLARLAGAPKHHLADPALAARLLGQTRHHLLAGDEGATLVRRDSTLLGNLFESLVALSVRTLAQVAGARTYHLRTEAGRHEIDCIIERDGAILAVEAKLGAAVNDDDTRHLRWLAKAIGPDLVDLVVVTTGPEAYRRQDGVAVIPLGALGV